MLFAIPVLVNAQKKCPDGNCPKGSTCVDGYCVKSDDGGNGGGNGGGGCNCFVRPIPFKCGQICGFLTDRTNANETNLASVYNSDSQSATISFSLEQAEKLSVNIFDMTGRLVKTLADKIFEQGEHQLQWDAAGVNAGMYMVQFNAGTYSEAKKIAVIK